MKKGTVKALTLGHKNGSKIMRAGDVVTEKDVNDFDKLVQRGFIQIEEAKAETKEEAKAETKKATKAKSK